MGKDLLTHFIRQQQATVEATAGFSSTPSSSTNPWRSNSKSKYPETLIKKRHKTPLVTPRQRRDDLSALIPALDPGTRDRRELSSWASSALTRDGLISSVRSGQRTGLVKNSFLDRVGIPEEAHQRQLQNEHFLQMLKSKSQPRSHKALPLDGQT